MRGVEPPLPVVILVGSVEDGMAALRAAGGLGPGVGVCCLLQEEGRETACTAKLVSQCIAAARQRSVYTQVTYIG